MNHSTINTLSKINCLLSVDRIGPQKIFELIRRAGTLSNLFKLNERELAEIVTKNSEIFSRLVNAIEKIDTFQKLAEVEIEKLERIDADLIFYWDPSFPKILKRIYSPPIMLYIKGNLQKLYGDSLSVVGTRMPSSYGKSVAANIVKDLAQSNVNIVSGLARGIDSIAHSTTLKNDGKTIAVIGSGLDVIYPPENKKLFEAISENGAVISEFPLGTKPDAPNFPRRNRIIAGLSLGTLVIETKIKGGALLTAEQAFSNNREVFAVPGNIGSSKSEGTNYLIKRNIAKLVTSAQDILEELNIKPPSKQKKISHYIDLNLNVFEEKILSVLGDNLVHIDKISEKTQLSQQECMTNLLTLEFKGLVKQEPGKLFLRI
ncbi:MAG: DNA-processing protein DprA [Melioribacteraceae bacterium]|nr:DNA-processing protein DprA [Melioribacteraceae bacterium]